MYRCLEYEEGENKSHNLSTKAALPLFCLLIYFRMLASLSKSSSPLSSRYIFSYDSNMDYCKWFSAILSKRDKQNCFAPLLAKYLLDYRSITRSAKHGCLNVRRGWFTTFSLNGRTRAETILRRHIFKVISIKNDISCGNTLSCNPNLCSYQKEAILSPLYHYFQIVSESLAKQDVKI